MLYTINTEQKRNPYRHKKSRQKRAVFFINIILLTTMGIFIFKVCDSFIKANSNNENASSVSSIVSNHKAYGTFDTDDEWQLILVNSENPLPDDYKVELVELSTGESVDKRIYPYLQDMFNSAIADNVYPLANSGYRTHKEQNDLLTQEINNYKKQGYSKKQAKELALEWVAFPGTSEHQLGISIDINADKQKCSNDIVYQWLYDNSYKYGFIQRYPLDKIDITGVNNEPWHYRYVGTEAAYEMYSQGICLEEYLEQIE